MEKKKAFTGVILFIALAVILGLVWRFTRPEAAEGEKRITVEVIHGNQTTSNFAYDTDEEYLGALLQNEGLISGTEGPYGLYVETVDGETADYAANGSWWKLGCNGEDSQLGVDAVPVNDGDQYTWTYTIG